MRNPGKSKVFTLKSNPESLIVSCRTMLDFGCLSSLRRRRAFEVMTLVYGIAVFMWDSCEPGARKEEVQVGEASLLKKRRPWECWLVNCMSCFGWVLVAHFQVRELMKRALLSFETLMITSSVVVAETIKLYNRFTVAQRSDQFDTAWAMAELTYRLVAIFPLAAFISSLDAILCPRILKIIFLFLCALTYAYHCLHARFISNEWAGEEFCFSDSCVQLKTVFVAASANIFVFTFKLLLHNLMGRNFTVIHPNFQLPENANLGWCLRQSGKFSMIVPEAPQNDKAYPARTR